MSVMSRLQSIVAIPGTFFASSSQLAVGGGNGLVQPTNSKSTQVAVSKTAATSPHGTAPQTSGFTGTLQATVPYSKGLGINPDIGGGHFSDLSNLSSL